MRIHTHTHTPLCPVTHCPCNELPSEEKSSANELVGDHQDMT